MELILNIPENTYSVPTEVRPEVVQAICEAFLSKTCRSYYHPTTCSVYRQSTNIVSKSNCYGFGFESKPEKDHLYYKIRGCEMKEAFKALRMAGWHIFRFYEFGEWLCYKVSAKPYIETRGAVEVTEFTEFID